MWDSLEKPWQTCLELAWESYREGSVPIAAVITDAEGCIITQGRNLRLALPAGGQNQIAGGPLAHAEINALLALDWAKVAVYTLELFTLVEPCPLCMGAICMAGVKTVRYAAPDAWAGSTNLLDASPYFRQKLIKAFPAANPELETVVQILQVDHMLASGHPRTEQVVQKWNEADPDNTRRGRAIHETGEIRRMASRGLTARDAIDRIHNLAGELDH
jgi:tRNA(Arg) A34 adenosine deaminase TadA